jgi:hypothetical protein
MRCSDYPRFIEDGIDGRPVAYVGCKTSHGNTIITGADDCLVDPLSLLNSRLLPRIEPLKSFFIIFRFCNVL